MKNVNLPKLISINIENYSLYKKSPTFKFNFHDGISAIIGGNGIGKTTFVETILFGLLGHRKIYTVPGKKKIKTKEKISNPDFFTVRMNESYKNNNLASVSLDYNIGSNKILIQRSLFNDKILYLRINDHEYDENVEEEFYQSAILNMTGLSSYQNFDKIVRTFLFFDERRDNIAWDPQVQDEILRILFFEESFLEKFKELENEVITLDTMGRHRSEARRTEAESLEDLKNEKSKLYTSLNLSEDSDEQNDLEKLLDRKNILEEERHDIEQKLEVILEEFSKIKSKADTAIGERNEFFMSMENVDTEVSKLESKLYKSIYNQLPDYYVSIEKVLISEGKCLACGNKNKSAREKAIERKKENKCLICASELQIVEEYDSQTIGKINEIAKIKTELEIKISNKDYLVSQLQDQVQNCNIEIVTLRDLLNNKHRELINLESLIARENLANGPDTYSQIIEAKNRRIEVLKKEVEGIYNLRDQKKKELNKINNQFKEIVINLNQHLSHFFNKYASTFLGLNCELTVEERMVNKIPHILYLPRISGSIREGTTSVSESQRFFLDQAFRMAIIDYLQNTIPGFETFFITETPEGSLDIVYESQVAAMFLLFAKSSNNIIFTSNLNSSNFLMKLYDSFDMEERNLRTLNLLEKGNPTKLQRDNKDLQALYIQLLGSE